MKQRRKSLRLGKSVIIGIRLGAVIVGIAAIVTLAVIGFQTYQARTGLPGGEILIIPAFALFFYTGWTARKDTEEYRKIKRREEQRHAARSRNVAASGGEE